MLSYDDALRIILDTSAPLPSERRAPVDALDRVLAAPVIAGEALPPFDNSAMDGYALAGDGVVPAGTELDVRGEQAAGDDAVRAEGQACAIMTGARVPDGFDRIVPVERTEALAHGADGTPSRIRLTADVAPAANLRPAGSDVPQGDTVMHAGERVTPNHLMLLAALGVAEVAVAARPRAALLCTGRELVDDPTQPLGPGQIRNSNAPFLAERLRRAGAEVVHVETVGDDIDAFLAALQRARDAGAQMLLSTGAVSMGRYDFVPEALQRLGGTALFHKVAIRPGKPLLYARLDDGLQWFGLPGNPISGAVGLRFFVEPALRARVGLPPEQPLFVPLAHDYRVKPSLRFHLKARLGADARGQLSVHILDGQESYRIRPLAAANCWVVIPAGHEQIHAGTPVAVYGPGHLEAPWPDTIPA
ncbi:molybdopterin molybdotransferase MoeA [Oleiagrimonas soli]|uniref:molybdopterin molybdotransferase MoeA n=1 Tax=Oleiagrimonas soli TaxID=1543381 RepID=UPI0016188980|nr:gephyrin-like molybdotransferase Glp [Oleiagrimonas soli]